MLSQFKTCICKHTSTRAAKCPGAVKTMPLGLRLAPKALPAHSWQCTDTCSVPQYELTPEDGMSVPRLLAIPWREAVEFFTEQCRKIKLSDKG